MNERVGKTVTAGISEGALEKLVFIKKLADYTVGLYSLKNCKSGLGAKIDAPTGRAIILITPEYIESIENNYERIANNILKKMEDLLIASALVELEVYLSEGNHVC